MTGHRKQHNAFTNREVELISTHWPTRMPMAELLALLPRHTENSITGYANKVLGLSRPHVRTVKPAWTRLRAMLEQQPMSQIEIAAAMGFSRARASELLNVNRDQVHIASWRWPAGLGRAEALWELGDEPDACEPMGEQRMRKMAARRVNPFLVATGAVAAPTNHRGRVVALLGLAEHEAA